MSTSFDPIATLCRLIAYPSVSDQSNATISDDVTDVLQSLNFDVERTEYLDPAGTTKVNLVARRDGDQATSARLADRGLVDGGLADGGLAYFCHTDVVPAQDWTGPGGDPFNAVNENGRIYGRGSCDMKGSLVAMLAAAAQIDSSEQTAPLWIACTADEEVGFQGAKDLVKQSAGYRQIVDRQPMSIIGEPTQLGAVHAHKGITGFAMTSRGLAAHSSLDQGINANEAMVPMLQTLLELCDQSRTDPKYRDARFEPPTLSWNFGVSDGDSAINITPEKSTAWVTIRTMPEIDGEDLIQVAKAKAEELGLEFKRYSGGAPLWIDRDAGCIQAIGDLTQSDPKTVCYATDGGEFGELSQRVVCGPGNIAQAHTTDEYLELDQLEKGIDLFTRAIRRWCC